MTKNDGSLTPVALANKKKNLDIAKIQRMGSKQSNMSSMIDSQFECENDYTYEEQKQLFEDINKNNDEDNEMSGGSGFGSSLKIPLSKYKMLNHHPDEEQNSSGTGQFMKYRNTRDFSPVTPSKANVIRTGM